MKAKKRNGTKGTNHAEHAFCFYSTESGAQVGGVGVSYGAAGTNLPAPAEVARFLSDRTVIDRVRILDPDPSTLRAFAGSGPGLALALALPASLVPALTDLSLSRRLVQALILPSPPPRPVARVLLGADVASSPNRTLALALVPAMQNLHTALAASALHRRVKVCAPQSLAILASSSPPSSGRFADDGAVTAPLLRFLRATGAPFMVSAYPFLGATPETLDYALFRINPGVVDRGTGLVYGNMLDAQLDAVYAAATRLGFGDVEIAVGETGWPSSGVGVGVGVDFAREYNANLVRHVASGVGTPLMPNRTFETYVSSMFDDDDLGPGPTSATRNFGLFRPDFTPVYDIGLLKPDQGMKPAISALTPTSPTASDLRRWCIAKPNADVMVLQENLDYACGQGINCSPIQPGGACYYPDTVQAHAAYAMNEYYQASGRNTFDCDFGQSGMVMTTDPSYGNCKYSS
ncbi:Glucan endo-1,3-beta-glucosidase [Ananas comosus]|uniref:Glucan endo-1,3-beta-glucosidase n=1 Tax=Ananas comosus TaxID=4615 RepID=A0A199V1X5_ANACO|nr:Glucan endo-1,3-beta-glucosidase [Ananas comosus]